MTANEKIISTGVERLNRRTKRSPIASHCRGVYSREEMRRDPKTLIMGEGHGESGRPIQDLPGPYEESARGGSRYRRLAGDAKGFVGAALGLALTRLPADGGSCCLTFPLRRSLTRSRNEHGQKIASCQVDALRCGSSSGAGGAVCGLPPSTRNSQVLVLSVPGLKIDLSFQSGASVSHAEGRDSRRQSGPRPRAQGAPLMKGRV